MGTLVALGAVALISLSDSNPIELLDSTYTVNVANGNGAGFVVEGGYVLTANHVVQGYERVQLVASLPSREKVAGVVIFTDKQNDIAVINPIKKLEGPILIFAKDLPKQGDAVYAAGSPIPVNSAQRSNVLSRGTVSDVSNEQGKIVASIPVDHGDSGGPLINSHNEVLGLVVEMAVNVPNVSYSEPVSVLKQALKTAIAQAENGTAGPQKEESVLSPTDKSSAAVIALVIFLASLSTASLFFGFHKKKNKTPTLLVITLDEGASNGRY